MRMDADDPDPRRPERLSRRNQCVGARHPELRLAELRRVGGIVGLESRRIQGEAKGHIDMTRVLRGQLDERIELAHGVYVDRPDAFDDRPHKFGEGLVVAVEHEIGWFISG